MEFWNTYYSCKMLNFNKLCLLLFIIFIILFTIAYYIIIHSKKSASLLFPSFCQLCYQSTKALTNSGILVHVSFIYPQTVKWGQIFETLWRLSWRKCTVAKLTCFEKLVSSIRKKSLKLSTLSILLYRFTLKSTMEL